MLFLLRNISNLPKKSHIPINRPVMSWSVAYHTEYPVNVRQRYRERVLVSHFDDTLGILKGYQTKITLTTEWQKESLLDWLSGVIPSIIIISKQDKCPPKLRAKDMNR